MKWEIIVLWESRSHLGKHCRSYEVDTLTKALRERRYILEVDPTADVIIKRIKQ